MSTSLTAYERETIVTSCDADDHVSIHTAQRSVLGILRRKASHNPYVVEVASGHYGSTPWAEFRIPVKRVSWGGLVKRGGQSPTVVPFPSENGPVTDDLDPVERQTTIVTNDDEDGIVVETTQRSVYGALHRKALVSDHVKETGGAFQIDGHHVSWGGFVKRMGSGRANAFQPAERAGNGSVTVDLDPKVGEAA